MDCILRGKQIFCKGKASAAKEIYCVIAYALLGYVTFVSILLLKNLYFKKDKK